MSTPKLTLPDLAAMKVREEKIVMVTAYDACAGRLADEAGLDLILVGDSAAMTMMGQASTVPVTMDEMLFLTRSVTSAVRRAIVIGDMPFGSYQASNGDAVRNAVRFIKEAGADAVKLEGAGTMLSRAEAIVAAGIPVMGHLGLTPQSATMLGGFKAQGRTLEKARQLRTDARELEEMGCFAVVLEAVPPPVARRVTEALSIPTIGIGAGLDCDGQILIWHDLLGFSEDFTPRFVKQYADLGAQTRHALETFVSDVRSSAFPEDQHTYAMPQEELYLFEQEFA